uniref:Uncharacterized protein n=1 Tax=Setaria viridis TaxID=4556 RepID=A0A4U6UQK0_SETVI|nr:hypothetical protein SEVIR_5G376300v2 [Setaria viridis]
MEFSPCVQIEDEHKTFANAQFFAINGNFIPKERPAVHTNQASCGALYPSALELDKSFSGAKNSPEGRITNGKTGCYPRETLAVVLKAPAAPLSFHNREEINPAKPQNKAAGKASQEESNSWAQNPPKDPILPRERQAFTSEASKQPPKALSPSPSSPN